VQLDNGVQGSKRPPNVSIDRLNAVSREILRDLRIAERFPAPLCWQLGKLTKATAPK